MAKQKTSISLRDKTLRKLKKEAKRQRRSVSQVVEIWIEDELSLNGEIQVPAQTPEMAVPV
jgi:predicted CopG family antitoxin